MCLVDLGIGPNVAEGMRRITPVRFVETPDQKPDAGWYDCPFPLSEKHFLVSYSFSARETDTRGYAIYLIDVYGGKELIYRDEELSALFPTPLRPRRRPEPVAPVCREEAAGFGELMIQDIHEGLDASARGKARYVRIVEADERHVHTNPYALEVGPDSGFETKRVLGTVPVESDGSAYFLAPANRGLFFSVLDEDYRALHTMRSVTNIQPGERTGCVGCHEPIFQYHMSPGTFGSRTSPLMDVLAKGHYRIKLPDDQWRLLSAWIDCNAPYMGDYGVVAIETAASDK